MPPTALFAGPQSLRVPGERAALWWCALAAPVGILIAGKLISSVSISGFVLLVVAGMVFVSVGRGRLLGSSVRIHGRQMPEIDAVVHDIAARLGLPVPQIFVRDDPFVPIAALGVGEPYALVLSSQYVEHLRRGELAFLVARELAHIAAGHTRVASLLSASGRENPVVALVFGAWLRRTEYTADRAGLLCCGTIDDALGAIAISTFHAVGRRVDMAVLAEQQRDLEAEPALRMGEWVAAVPYATNRLAALRGFDASPLAREWRARLAEPRPPPVAVEVAVLADRVRRRDCAGFWRRSTALGIDLVVIAAILKTPAGVVVLSGARNAAPGDVPPIIRTMLDHMPTVQAGAAFLGALAAYYLYGALLVALSGQTLGMLIFELRVVTTRFARPSLPQSVWRYAAAFGSTLTAVALLGCVSRVHPHDRLSRTRVVRGRRAA